MELAACYSRCCSSIRYCKQHSALGDRYAGSGEVRLLDFAFLIVDMFAHNRIVFFEYHLVGGVALVLVGSIKVAGTC